MNAHRHQEMEMIAHDYVADQLPAVADDRVLEAHDRPASVRFIADDLLLGVARAIT
jgi:hypothetical protein